MAFPFRLVVAAAVVLAYVVSSRTGSWDLGRFLLLVLAAVAAQFLAWAAWAAVLYPKMFSPLIGLPEPSGNDFFMGQWKRILADPSGTPMMEWINSIPHDGIIRYLGMFNQERVLLASPKALAEVLVTKNYEFEKPEQLRWSIGRVLGIGVLLAEGDEHKVQRKNLAPAFAFRHVKNLYPVFWGKAREGVQAMLDQVAKGGDQRGPTTTVIATSTGNVAVAAAADTIAPTTTRDIAAAAPILEVSQWASRITLDIIGVAGMGRDFGAIRDPDNELNRTYAALFRPSRQAQMLAILGLLLPGWLVNLIPVKRNGDVVAAAGVIRGECRSLIRAKRARMAAAAAQHENGDKKEQQQRSTEDVDILSVALESGAFTEDNLVDQLMTFLAAGHDTTASAMTWATYLLSCHPEVQARLRDEVRTHLPPLSDPAQMVTSADIDRLPYLQAVCSEVLRYFSPVPLTVRVAARDTSILGRRVPRGTRIMIVPWAVNKSVELWGEDALQFNPDRWLTQGKRQQPDSDSGSGRENGSSGKAALTSQGRSASPAAGATAGAAAGAAAPSASGGASSNYAFLTFLHGPRSCVGAAFARAEFACLLASWVGRFEFALADDRERDERNLVIRSSVTARPANGLRVKVKVLDGW